MSCSDWKNDVIRLRSEGISYNDIIDQYREKFPGKTDEQLRSKFSKAVSLYNAKKDTPSSNFKEGDTWANGQLNRDRLIEICETDNITPELILTLHHLPPSEWEVITYRNNFWHAQKKGGVRMIMYQSRLTVKPVYGRVTFEDVEAYFKDKVYPAPPTITMDSYDQSGETLEIDIADLHSGLLAWCRETGEDYDIHIVKDRFMRVITDNIERCQGRQFKQIIVALLGDLLHVDNDLQQTTKGTFQQVDGRTKKVFEVTLDMLIDAVLMLGKIAPVDVVYTSGNHDANSGWMLIKSLQMAFLKDSNVHVDIEPDPQKDRLIGQALIGFVHGDMPEKNLAGWLQVRARNMLVKIRFMEVHCGHRHAQKVKEIVQTTDNEGVVVRTMPTLTSASKWEHGQGYSGATCTSMSFVWHDKNGLREMWYCNM